MPAFHKQKRKGNLLGSYCLCKAFGGLGVAAFDQRYKLIYLSLDKPWLYDLEKDPDELVNYFVREGYDEQFIRLKDELIAQMKKFKEPALTSKNLGTDKDYSIFCLEFIFNSIMLRGNG